MKSVIFMLIICHKCIITSKTKINIIFEKISHQSLWGSSSKKLIQKLLTLRQNYFFSAFYLLTVYKLNILKSCYRILKQNETLEGYSKKNFALLLLLECEYFMYEERRTQTTKLIQNIILWTCKCRLNKVWMYLNTFADKIHIHLWSKYRVL